MFYGCVEGTSFFVTRWGRFHSLLTKIAFFFDVSFFSVMFRAQTKEKLDEVVSRHFELSPSCTFTK